MGTTTAESGMVEGYEALASGNWAAARAAFEAALAVEESPEALEGALERHSTGGLYLNFPGLGEEKEALVRAGYGAPIGVSPGSP